MTSPFDHNSPTDYAEDKLHSALPWWNGRLGALQRQYGSDLAPRIHPALWAGFGTNGDPRSAGGTAPFWEIGWAGITGGTVALVPPSQDLSEPNSWFDEHDDARVIAELGRPASMEIGGWRHLEDQTAVGIVSLLEDGYSLSRSLRAHIRPAGDITSSPRVASCGGTWFSTVMFAAWSAGHARAALHINPYADRLASIPEDGRMGALFYFAAMDAWNGAHRGPVESHENPIWTFLRTWQKVEAARWIAQSTGYTGRDFDLNGQADWTWVQAVITRVAYGRSLAGLSAPGGYRYTAPPRVSSRALVGALGAASAAAVAWWVWRNSEPSLTGKRNRV